MRKQLSEKLKEAVASVVPVTLIVLLLQIITPMPTNMLIAFLASLRLDAPIVAEARGAIPSKGRTKCGPLLTIL